LLLALASTVLAFETIFFSLKTLSRETYSKLGWAGNLLLALASTVLAFETKFFCLKTLSRETYSKLGWSGNLLLALASTVLGFGPHDHIFIGSKTIYVFGNGTSSSRRGGADLSELLTYPLPRERVYRALPLAPLFRHSGVMLQYRR
jgi:hypothetical protein